MKGDHYSGGPLSFFPIYLFTSSLKHVLYDQTHKQAETRSRCRHYPSQHEVTAVVPSPLRRYVENVWLPARIAQHWATSISD